MFIFLRVLARSVFFSNRLAIKSRNAGLDACHISFFVSDK